MSPEATPKAAPAADLERRLRWSVEGAKPRAPGVLGELVREVPAQYRQLGRPARLWQKAVFGREKAVALGGAALVIALVAGLAFVATRPAGQQAGSQASEIALATATASASATEYATPGQTPDWWSTSDGSPSPTMRYAPPPRPSLSATACASVYVPPSATPTRRATPVPTATAAATAAPTESATSEPSDSAAATAEAPASSPTGDAGVAGPAWPAAAPLVYGAASPASWTWQRGWSAAFAGMIVATPAGYLATIEVRSGRSDADYDYRTLGYAMCTSPDLIHWYPPTNRKVFVNETGGYFYPDGPIPVNKGYGAGSHDWYNESVDRSEWYSSDGIHWREGIPDDVRVSIPEAACTEAIEGDCGAMVSTARGELSMYWDGTAYFVTKDVGLTWKTAKMPEGTKDRPRQLVAVSGGLFAGRWDIFPRSTSVGMVVPIPVFMVSSDGISWRKVTAVDGAYLLARGSELFVEDGASLWRSSDGFKTWVELKGPSGESIDGYSMAMVGSKIVVFDGELYDGYFYQAVKIHWIGTPH
jgi:hypothetical protein